MKGWPGITAGSSLIVAVVGSALVITNPSQRDYEEYAVEQLGHHLRTSLCDQLPQDLVHLTPQCRSLGQTVIDVGRPQLKQLIFEQTERRNYFFFSVYRTRLAFSTLTPIYQFHTLGVLQKFYVYDIQEL